MADSKNSYRQIFKATSIFGGVQIFNIFIAIIRSKIIAEFLGPAGMGIMGLLTYSIGLITSLTNFGLGTSAVKNIAEGVASNDKIKIAKVVIIFKKIIWFTGILGLLVTLLLSPLLSEITFGNKTYTSAFVWLSITLLFSQLTNGKLVVLQGLLKLKDLAKANLYGSILGLIIVMPLYYFFKIDGIVYGLIGTSLASLFVSWCFESKIKIESVKIAKTEMLIEGNKMLRMGFLISMSGLFAVFASYLVRLFINKIGGVEQVGLYSAGFAIINTYVGLIFNAMATDFYPRLSLVAHDNNLSKNIINQQAEVALLILAPILLIFIVFINIAICILYSKDFLSINQMIYWAALGMYFKAASWPIGFILLAKGNGKMFFLSEFTLNLYMLIFNIIGYYYGGLTGLGVSFLISYIIYLLQIYFIGSKMYKFNFDKMFIKIFTFQLFLAFIGFLNVKIFNNYLSYLIGVCLIFFSMVYSLNGLEKRLGFALFCKLKIIITGKIK